MFGNPLKIEYDGLAVVLRPIKKEEMPRYADLLSYLEVTQWTAMVTAKTPEDEYEWWEKTRKDETTVLWAITVDKKPIGITGLHNIERPYNSCSSGIIIGRRYWGKGVATRAHLARTWYAANILNRYTIQSTVRVPNKASLKALKRVGYINEGRYLRTCVKHHSYFDTYVLTWLNPFRIGVLYPEGLPRKYRKAVKKARLALERAEQVVTPL